MNSELTCTVVNWGIVTDLLQLYYYFRSGKREYDNYFLASTVVIQLPQISYFGLQAQSEFKFKILGQNGVYGEDLKSLTLRTKKVRTL